MVLVGAAPADAAEYAGIVTGAGVPIPGATITAIRADKQVVTTTDQAGIFHFADLDDGPWTIRVEMLGFETVSKDVAIAAGLAPSQWPLTLRNVQDLIQSIGPRVSTGSNASTSAGGSNASVPATASRANTRNRSNTSGPATSPAAPNPGNGPNAAPASAASNPSTPSDPFGTADGYLVNGSVNNGAASPFAQMAAFGNNRRGQRSLYNGGIGIQLGNSAWDARPFSFGAAQTPKPSYDTAQVLATFAGPIRLQRWFRNSPNVFFGYQRVADQTATTQSALVPTRRERNGDFSQTVDAFGRPVQPVDPVTHRPFPNGVIPTSLLSPQAQSLLQYYPAPNLDAGGRYNYQTPVLVGTRQDSAQLRMTHSVNGRNQLFGSLSVQRATTDAGNMFGFTDATRVSTIDTSINWSHRFSQFLSARFRYQYTRQSTDVTPYFANHTNVSGDAGISGNNQEPANWGPPALTFASGVAGLRSAQFAANDTLTHAVGVEVLKAIPRHNLTIGADVSPQHVNVLSQQDPRGTFSFTGAATGSDLADFLLGVPSTSSIAFGNADKRLRARNADAYFSDDWRVTPTLTINAGVRWEFESPFSETGDRLVNLDIAPGFSAASPVTAAEGLGATTGQRYPASLLRADWGGVQPRFGVAWRPVPGSSLVVRGGYGLYRNTNVYQSLALLLAQQAPFSKTLSVANAPATPLTLANGFPAVNTATPNTFAIDPDFRVAAVQSWQLSAQRDLPGSLTVIGTYLGAKGSGLMQEFLPNTYPVGSTNPCPACPTGFVYLTSGGSSLRNAGQVQLRRRLRNGLTGSVQYTLAKATDNAAAFLRAGDGTQTTSSAGFIAQDWRDLNADRGPSAFDQRHQLVGELQYTTGMGIGGGALLDGLRGRLFRGWTVTAQLNTGSGLPQTPVYLVAVPGTGVTGTVRAALTGVSPDVVPAGYYANPAAYAAPAAGQWGSAGRNSITGPVQFSLNGGLSRAFLLSDRLTLDWRVEATNLLNRVTYASINTIVGSPQFGLPIQANTMRRVQTSARLRF
jgi:carboxypeptidase family protein